MFIEPEGEIEVTIDLDAKEVRLKCLSMAVQVYEAGDDVIDLAQQMYDFVQGTGGVKKPHLVQG